MPILPAEPDIYPENLLEPERFEATADHGWWAAYTLPRREKELMRRLRALEVPFYCPLIARRTRSPQGRVRISHVPLFASYVFLFGPEEQRGRALTTNCISRTIAVPDAVGLAHDLRQIQRLILSGAPLTPEARLEPGMHVRIKSGSLAGLEGQVVEKRGQERLVVAVEFLQQGASLLLDDYLLERID